MKKRHLSVMPGVILALLLTGLLIACPGANGPATVAVAEVSIDPVDTARVAIGGELELTATVEPGGATDSSVIWVSSNTAIATVESVGGLATGKPGVRVKGVAGGTVTITAASRNNPLVSATIEITVFDPNDTTSPEFTSGVTATAIDENSGAGQEIYTAVTTDVSAVTYTLGGTDVNSFSINGTTGIVTLAGDPDFEDKSSYSFDVTATDATGNDATQTVTLEIKNVDENAPVFTIGTGTASVDENTVIVYVAEATDDVLTNTVTYALAGAGVDNGLFDIGSTSGEVTLKNNASPDYEIPTDVGEDNIYNITITASDGTNVSAPFDVAITINDIGDEDVPVFTSGDTVTVAIDENIGAGQEIYTTATTDASDVIYTLGGTDGSLFSIGETTGIVTLTADPDYETKNSYSFEVIAIDAAGNSARQTVTLEINNLTD